MIKGETVVDLAAVYDRFADTYHDNRGAFDISPLLRELLDTHQLSDLKLLDLGCGAGEPVAATFLKEGWQVTGVDISKRMLDLADQFAPDMVAINADMREADFIANAFSLITIIYALFHVPVEDHEKIMASCFKWLQPGGRLMFTYATEHYTGHATFNGTLEFMGEILFYSHIQPERMKAQIRDIGFVIESATYRELGGETFLWVIARKPYECTT